MFKFNNNTGQIATNGMSASWPDYSIYFVKTTFYAPLTIILSYWASQRMSTKTKQYDNPSFMLDIPIIPSSELSPRHSYYITEN